MVEKDNIKLKTTTSKFLILVVLNKQFSVMKQFSSEQLQEFIMQNIEKIIAKGPTMTQPGSLKYLLYGSQVSDQSVSIKMGKVGEEIVKKIINETPHLELLDCGVQIIDPITNKKKDLDLIWKNEKNKNIYYREAKGNLQLDSEKLPATIDKMKEILETFIKQNYPGYTINIAVYNWSVYNRKPLKKELSQIKKCESKNIQVEHPEDLFELLEFNWTEENYYKFFREVGKKFLQQ